MSRSTAAGTHGVNLMPLLDVLLCTMGTLIVILGVINRVARLHPEKRMVGKAAQQQELSDAKEDLQLRVQELTTAREKTLADLNASRVKLSGVEDSAREMEDHLQALVAASKDLKDTNDNDPQRAQLRAQIAQLDAQRLQAEAELRRARYDSTNRQPGYAIVPFDEMYKTNRRPIYIECCDSGHIILQPEGIVFSREDFIGPEGPSNPLASALRAAQEYWRNAPRPAPDMPNEPYPLILVRPDGIMGYRLARYALSSWDAEFGYELVGQNWKLDFPMQPDPQLKEQEERAVAESRKQLQWLAQVSPEMFSRKANKVQYRVSAMGGGVVRDGGASLGGDSFDDDPLGGFGLQQGNSPRPGLAVGGNGNGFGGNGFAGNGLGSDRYANSGFGNGNPGFNGNGAPGSNGNGTPGFSGGGNGAPLLSGPAGSNLGYGPGFPGNSVSGTGGKGPFAGSAAGSGAPFGAGTGTTGGTGYGPQFADVGPRYASNGGSGFGNSCAGLGNGNGAGGSGSANGGTGNNNTGANGPGGAAIANSASGTGTSSGAPGSTGNSNLAGTQNPNSNGTPGNGYGNPSEYGGVQLPPSASNPSAGGMASSGPGSGTAGATGSPGSASGINSAQGATGGQYAVNSGPLGSSAAYGTYGGSSAMGGAGSSGSSGGSMSSGGSDATSGGQSSSMFGGSSDPSSAMGGPSMSFDLTPQQQQNAASYEQSTSQSSNSSMSHNVARNRGKNWALPSSHTSSMPIDRPIRVECWPDRLVLVPDTHDQQAQVIPLGPRTEDAVDPLVNAVRTYTKSWGIAGRSMYWKPQLVLNVNPNADVRAADLQTLLADSGWDVKRK